MRKISLSDRLQLAFKYPGSAANFVLSKLFGQKRIWIITFFPTERCNLNCSGCLVKESRTNYLKKRPDLTFHDFTKVIREFEVLKPFLYFTGGEPLLNEDIFKMISNANEEKFVTTLTTNGIILSEKCKDMLNSGLLFLSVSINGFEKEHDKTQGVTGAFNKTIKGLTKLLDKRDGKNPRVKVNTIITSENYNQLGDLVAFLFDLGIDEMSLQHYSFYTDKMKLAQDECAIKYGLGTGVEGCNIESTPYLNEYQIGLLRKEICKIRKSGFEVEIKPRVNEITEYYLGFQPSNKSKCNRISKEAVIRATGEIELCSGYVIGTISEGVKKSFYGAKAEKLRSHIANQGLIPACYRCCALSYDFLRAHLS